MNTYFELDIDEELLAARDHINTILQNSGIGDNVVLSVPDSRKLEDIRQELYKIWLKYSKHITRKG